LTRGLQQITSVQGQNVKSQGHKVMQPMNGKWQVCCFRTETYLCVFEDRTCLWVWLVVCVRFSYATTLRNVSRTT